jgi:hypothetical protein
MKVVSVTSNRGAGVASMGRKVRSGDDLSVVVKGAPTGELRILGPALPKGTLEKLSVGHPFSEYDPSLGDPNIYVMTPAFHAALNEDSGKYFFVGRRGTGKTALRIYCEVNAGQTRAIIPEIFSPTSRLFEVELLRNSKKGPFRALVSAFKRVLFAEVILLWKEKHPTYVAVLPSAISRELEGACRDDFDTRALKAIQSVADAIAVEDDAALIQGNIATRALLEELKTFQSGGSYTILIDSIDDYWDASDQALIYLTAFLHACLEFSAHLPWARAIMFLRENIFERVRARDSESSRLETSLAGLAWTPKQLLELVEKRLNRGVIAKFSLGGATWDAFFENGQAARSEIFEYCHHRPRDVLIYVSDAIDSAKENGHPRILLEDIEGARRKFSDNRLKDLGDEYAENYPQIALVLTKFYGLGRRFTLSGMEALIRGLLADNDVRRLCGSWIFENQAPELFIRLLYNIGFMGLEKPGKAVKFRALGPQDTVPPAIDSDVTIVVHKCYWDALELQDKLVQELPGMTELGRIGLVSELPGGIDPATYEDRLADLAERIESIPVGHLGARDFEVAIGDLLSLCFFRALDNFEERVRTVDGESIRDWIAGIRAQTGFWSVIRQRHNATQVIWECKNYHKLKAEDFQQVSYYLNDTIGKFAVIAFRGELEASYFPHIRRVASNEGKIILPLGGKGSEDLHSAG